VAVKRYTLRKFGGCSDAVEGVRTALRAVDGPRAGIIYPVKLKRALVNSVADPFLFLMKRRPCSSFPSFRVPTSPRTSASFTNFWTAAGSKAAASSNAHRGGRKPSDRYK